MLRARSREVIRGEAVRGCGCIWKSPFPGPSAAGPAVVRRERYRKIPPYVEFGRFHSRMASFSTVETCARRRAVARKVTQAQVGERLRALRKRAGFTQLEVASLLDTSNESVSRMERGEQWPRFEVLADLASIYGIELADLFVIPSPGRGSAQRAALQEVIDLLKPRKAADVELARDLLRTLFDRP